jgi:hypothetical protein
LISTGVAKPKGPGPRDAGPRDARRGEPIPLYLGLSGWTDAAQAPFTDILTPDLVVQERLEADRRALEEHLKRPS